jgi:phosphoglycolate phosphatase
VHERAVMIGDRAGDIEAARANGVLSVGVLWGYGSRAELVDARADDLCPSPGDLATCLARITR